MFCTQCGKQAPERAVHCAYCGAKMLMVEVDGARETAEPEGEGGVVPEGAAPEGARSAGQSQPWRAALAVAAGLVLLALSGYGAPRAWRGVTTAREAARDASCRSNVKQLAVATLMYAQDWDEHLPLKETWADGLFTYVNNRSIYGCPGMAAQRCGYAYDPALSGKSQGELSLAGEAVLLFDAKGDWNTWGTWDIADPRHGGTLNIAFADGHATCGTRDMIPASSSRCSATSGAPPSDEPVGTAANPALGYEDEWEQDYSLSEPTSFNGYYDLMLDYGDHKERWELQLQLQPASGGTFGGTASLIGSDGMGVPAGSGSSFTLDPVIGLQFRLHFMLGLVGGYVMHGAVSPEGNVSGTFEDTVKANAHQLATGKRPENEKGILSGHQK
jgi:prepilin-type processing-associated H-X9-DG protein